MCSDKCTSNGWHCSVIISEGGKQPKTCINEWESEIADSRIVQGTVWALCDPLAYQQCVVGKWNLKPGGLFGPLRQPRLCAGSWIPWKSSFPYILFHKRRLQTMLWLIQRQSQFTPKMKENAIPRLLSSLVWIDSGTAGSQHRLEYFFYEIKCNGMMIFMEFMKYF